MEREKRNVRKERKKRRNQRRKVVEGERRGAG